MVIFTTVCEKKCPQILRLVMGVLLTQHAQRLGHAGAIGRVCLAAVGDVARLDFLRGAADGAGSVVKQYFLLGWRHQAEQGTRLRVVIVVDSVIVVIGHAVQRQWWFGEVRLFQSLSLAVWLIADGAAAIAVDAHAAVPMVAVEWAFRACSKSFENVCGIS